MLSLIRTGKLVTTHGTEVGEVGFEDGLFYAKYKGQIHTAFDLEDLQRDLQFSIIEGREIDYPPARPVLDEDGNEVKPKRGRPRKK